MRTQVVAFATILFVTAMTSDLPAQSRARVRSKSQILAEHNRKTQQRERERAEEKARLEKGPSEDEIRRAGHPVTAAKRFIEIARDLRTPYELREHVAKPHWESYEARAKRFDPERARKELRALGNQTGRDADLKRRINTHPSKKFVESYQKIGKQVREITGARWHPNHKFKAVVTGKVLPDNVRDSWGNKAPTATLVFVLEDGKWKFEKYNYSIGIRRSGGR